MFGSDRIGDSCRVLLLLLAEHMTDAGYVSIPRETITAQLGVSSRRITARITEACRGGLLDQTGGGYHGVTARYVAVIPSKVDAERPPSRRIGPRKVDAERPPSDAKGGGIPSTFERPPFKSANRTEQPRKVDAERPPITRAYLDASDNHQTNVSDEPTDELAGQRIDKQPDCLHCRRALDLPSTPCPFHRQAS